MKNHNDYLRGTCNCTRIREKVFRYLIIEYLGLTLPYQHILINLPNQIIWTMLLHSNVKNSLKRIIKAVVVY